MKESHGTKKLIERMAKDSKLPKSIMKEVMACFVDAVKAEIEEGYSVRINGLCTIQIHDREKDPCNPKNVKVFLEGKYDEKSEWVEIKECELEPGDTVDITKETKKYVKTFKKFRFVRRIVDKTLVRSEISLLDLENGITYKIEE